MSITNIDNSILSIPTLRNYNIRRITQTPFSCGLNKIVEYKIDLMANSNIHLVVRFIYSNQYGQQLDFETDISRSNGLKHIENVEIANIGSSIANLIQVNGNIIAWFSVIP
jgi:hypothetical protein